MDMSFVIAAAVVIAVVLNAIAVGVVIFLTRRALNKVQVYDYTPRPPVLDTSPKPPPTRDYTPTPKNHSLYTYDSDNELACRHCGGSYRSKSHHEWCRYRAERDSDQYVQELKRSLYQANAIITENDWENV
jgi:peroxiredoxin family protein